MNDAAAKAWAGVLRGREARENTGRIFPRPRSHGDRKKLTLIASASALVVPTVGFALWCPSKILALLALLPGQALMCFFYGPAFSLAQGLCEAGIRATMASLLILLQVTAGGIIGIQLMGVLSDALAPWASGGGDSLRWGMSLITLLSLWAAAHFWWAGRTVESDLPELVGYPATN
jgi:hypothetical protein